MLISPPAWQGKSAGTNNMFRALFLITGAYKKEKKVI